MHLIETKIREEGGSAPVFKVEFSGDAGEVISVMIRQDDQTSRDNVVEKARALMIQIGSIEDTDDKPSSH